MPALVEITPWHRAGFLGCILFFLALDLGVFHREARVVSVKEAAAWTSLWVSMSLLFSLWLRVNRGPQASLEFLTGYLIVKVGLALVPVFIGIKMLLDPHHKEPLWFQLHIPIGVSLGVVAGIIATSIAVSLVVARASTRKG